MTVPFDQLKSHIRQAIKAQPFSTLLNARLTHIEKGFAQLEVPFSEDLTQQHTFLHGGVVGYLADNVCAAAAATEVGQVVTQEYKINFLAPALGENFIGKGYVIRAGKRQIVCRADVYAITKEGQEKLVATALATILPVDYGVKTASS
jgi:uncharacterized protein (TIGR00369 family)